MTVVSARDKAWFLEQVSSEQAGLRAFIRSKGVRSTAVDDFAQEALLVAWRKLEEFDREGSFGSWIRQIARRLIANERRKEDRRNRILSCEVTAELMSAESEQLHPAVEIERSEQVSALRACLAELPKASRNLLQQRYFEDLQPGIIASYQGCHSGQIRQQLLRLRRSLLQCVEQRLGT